MEQAILSSSKEVKLYNLISISESNLKSCEDVLKDASDNNTYLISENKKINKKLKRTRKIALYAILFAVLEGLVITVL